MREKESSRNGFSVALKFEKLLYGQVLFYLTFISHYHLEIL